MNELQSAADFGDAAAEYAAFETTRVVAACWGPKTLLKLTGDDRHKWLHNFCTNDIKALQPGSGCEAFFTNVKARVLGYGFVFATNDALWVETVGGQEDALFNHFDRYIITEDVEIHRLSESHRQLLVAGPDVIAKLAAVCSGEVKSLEPLQNITATIADAEVGLRRVDITGQPGLLINCRVEDQQAIWDHLCANAFAPVGRDAFEARRIEAVFPFYGTDVTDAHMAPEAGRNPVAISYTKGCYLGQEPIARLDAMGHTNKELRGIAFESDLEASVGDAVTSATGDNIGSLTSIARVPGATKTVALGYVKRAHMKDGADVMVNDTPGTVFSTGG